MVGGRHGGGRQVPPAPGFMLLPCQQASRGLPRTSGASGSVVLQPRGGRRAGAPHRQLRPGRRRDAELRCLGGGRECGDLPFTYRLFLTPFSGMIPPSCISEASGNHRRVRIPQAGGGGRWMLRIPIQIFTGYSYQPRRQARKKGCVLRECAGRIKVAPVEGALLSQIQKVCQGCLTPPFSHDGDTE